MRRAYDIVVEGVDLRRGQGVEVATVRRIASSARVAAKRVVIPTWAMEAFPQIWITAIGPMGGPRRHAWVETWMFSSRTGKLLRHMRER